MPEPSCLVKREKPNKFGQLLMCKFYPLEKKKFGGSQNQ